MDPPPVAFQSERGWLAVSDPVLSARVSAYHSAAAALLPPQRVPATALAAVLMAIGQADRAIAAADVPGAHEALAGAQQVLSLLRASLNHEVGGALATNLDGVYVYLVSELGRANIEKSRERLAALIPLVTELREAWQQAADLELHGQVAAAGGGRR